MKIVIDLTHCRNRRRRRRVRHTLLWVFLLNQILWSSIELRRLSPDQTVSPQLSCQKNKLSD